MFNGARLLETLLLRRAYESDSARDGFVLHIF